MAITEVDHSNPITLNRFILGEKEIQGNADLSVLFSSIELACKVIASSVRRAGLTGLYGLDGSENATGDQVKKMDVLANEVFINSLKFSSKIEVMVSEEEVEPVCVENNSAGTKYCIAFDPLDGSSNIDCNVSTGTIFGIYHRERTLQGGFKDILQPGNQLVAAGYCMYGSSTQLVLTWGKGVHCFTLDPTIGAFILSNKDMKIPENPKTVKAAQDFRTVVFISFCAVFHRRFTRATKATTPAGTRRARPSWTNARTNPSRTTLDTSVVWSPTSTVPFSTVASIYTRVATRARTASCVYCTKATPCRSSWSRPAARRQLGQSACSTCALLTSTSGRQSSWAANATWSV